MKFPFCGRGAGCGVFGRKEGRNVEMANKSPNGASYIHFISTGSQPDAGILLDTVNARVK